MPPLYDYGCPKNHILKNVTAKMDGSDAPTECPEPMAADITLDDHSGEWGVCGLPLTRLMGLVSSRFPGADRWRK